MTVLTLNGEQGRVLISEENWPLLMVKTIGYVDPKLTLDWHSAYIEIAQRKKSAMSI